MSGPRDGMTVRGGYGPFGLVADTLRLWLRFLPQLMAIALLSVIARGLLLEAAVSIGFVNHLAGLISLSVVVLVKLVVVVALFEVLRSALPAMKQASTGDDPPAEATATAASTTTPARPPSGTARVATILSLALVPFFAYYAAWGFLGDTIRDYSRLSLSRDPFGTRDEVAAYDLPERIRLFWLEDGDHDLKPRKSVSGFSAADHLATMAKTVKAFTETLA